MIIRSTALALPLRDACVDLIVTSPPYFALRSYRDGDEHYAGQLGSEETPAAFVDALIEATREMVRVLKPTGSIFVNLGDKYAGSGGHNNSNISRWEHAPLAGGKRTLAANSDLVNATRRNAPDRYNQNSDGIPAKSLMGLPWRYANACVDRLGLILRRDLIWHKPNGLPESVTDRCRSSHEYWFHFVKQGRYFSAIDEIREAQITPTGRIGERSGADHRREDGTRSAVMSLPTYEPNPLGKLPGSVWTIPSEPLVIPDWAREKYNLPDHFAAFPQEWPRRLILGWSPSGICTVCGEGRRPLVDKTQGLGPVAPREAAPGRPVTRVLATINGYACACEPPIPLHGYQEEILGYADTPWTPPPTTPAVVLDPFGGTGTVAMVARALGRTGLNGDLSGDYGRLARWRIYESGHAAKSEERTWRDAQGSML